MLLVTSVFVFALLLLPHVAAPGSAEVGWIERFEGSSRHYRLTRAGLEQRVRLFTPLLDGDEISVLLPSGKLGILLADGRRLELSHGAPVYLATGIKSGSAVPGNVLRWAQDLFTRWHEDAIAPAQIALRTGQTLSIPILSRGGGLLLGGDRPLTIAWVGGTPPFQLQIKNPSGGPVLVTLDRLENRRVLTRVLPLGRGQYEVVIRDRGNATIVGQVSVVDQLPPVPVALASEDVPSHVRDTLRAAWLASLDDGRWAFEAFQLAEATASAGYYPAVLLRDSLAAGERPLPPSEMEPAK